MAHVVTGEGRHWSPRRAQGLSSGVRGSAMRAAQVVLTSPSTDRVTATVTKPQPDVVDVGVDSTAPRNDHGVAREDRAQHAEGDPAQSAVRAGPVGEVALEPGRLVGRVQEDVLRAVAVDGEVLVVVHRSPVPGGQGTQHHRGGTDVVAQLGQLVARLHVVEQEHAAHR